MFAALSAGLLRVSNLRRRALADVSYVHVATAPPPTIVPPTDSLPHRRLKLTVGGRGAAAGRKRINCCRFID